MQLILLVEVPENHKKTVNLSVKALKNSKIEAMANLCDIIGRIG